MRWLIRGVCLVVLAGVVGVGLGSYAGCFEIFKHAAARQWGVGAVQGVGYISRSADVRLTTAALKFHFERGTTAPDIGLPPRTGGFFCGTWPKSPDSWLMIFPLWLAALVLVVLNGLVWRWTRRRKVGAPGFPVEPAKRAC